MITKKDMVFYCCRLFGLFFEKFEIRVEDLKVTLILQKERFLLILFFKLVLKSSDNLPINGKTFSAVNVTGFLVSLFLKKFLMQLSINLIGNVFFFNTSFK